MSDIAVPDSRFRDKLAEWSPVDPRSDRDRDRIVMARSMMWADASDDEQAKWLDAADRFMADVERAKSAPAPQLSGDEASAVTLRVVP